MCGYVLKPQYMISDSTPARPIVLSIHVISASQLPKPGGRLKGEIIDPFVNVQIHGIHSDDKIKVTQFYSFIYSLTQSTHLTAPYSPLR